MIERVKNYIIGLLFLSLIGLTVLNWFSWSDISFNTPAEVGEEFKQDTVMNVTRPISGDYDRYNIYLADFLALADHSERINAGEWSTALNEGGIHLEFLSAVPVWLFAEGLGATASELFNGVWLTELILYDKGLMTYDGKAYMRFTSPLPLNLPAQLETSDDSNIFPIAAMSNRFLDDQYRSELLETLGFNPNSNSQYPQPNGETVYVDVSRTLHVAPDGRVVYHDGTKYNESVELDERDAISLCLAVLPKGAAFWGEGNLVFNTVTKRDDGFDITLNYVLDGAVFIDGQTVFAVRGGVLREAVIYLSPAFFTEVPVRLMPKKRAMVLIPQGKKLCVGYRKNEGGLWTPEWYGY